MFFRLVAFSSLLVAKKPGGLGIYTWQVESDITSKTFMWVKTAENSFSRTSYLCVWLGREGGASFSFYMKTVWGKKLTITRLHLVALISMAWKIFHATQVDVCCWVPSRVQAGVSMRPAERQSRVGLKRPQLNYSESLVHLYCVEQKMVSSGKRGTENVIFSNAQS